MGELQYHTSSLKLNLPARWSRGFCHKAVQRGSLFERYFFKQATGHRGLPGHSAIIASDSSSLSCSPPGWFLVALSLNMTNSEPSDALLNTMSSATIDLWFSLPLLPKYKRTLNQAVCTKDWGVSVPSWFVEYSLSRSSGLMGGLCFVDEISPWRASDFSDASSTSFAGLKDLSPTMLKLTLSEERYLSSPARMFFMEFLL